MGVLGLNSGKTRSSLLGIVGGYLLYLAYELFRDYGKTETTMPPWVQILFIVLFGLIGVGLLVYAVRVWKNSGKEEEEKKQDDENNLK